MSHETPSAKLTRLLTNYDLFEEPEYPRTFETPGSSILVQVEECYYSPETARKDNIELTKQDARNVIGVNEPKKYYLSSSWLRVYDEKSGEAILDGGSIEVSSNVLLDIEESGDSFSYSRTRMVTHGDVEDGFYAIGGLSTKQVNSLDAAIRKELEKRFNLPNM